jgi:hypothetical protein
MFLTDVVNAYDRSLDLGTRRYFARQYRAWFPKAGTAGENWYREYYREVRMWWPAESGKIPEEEPDKAFGLQVVILRHKLMVIWSFVNTGDISRAEKLVQRVGVWLSRYQRGPYDDPNEEWRSRLMGAMEYLDRFLPLLKICESPECESRYFIRETQKKYCSTDCALRAQELRRLQRIKQGLPRRELTPEGRLKISQTQKERWRKYRAAKKQKNRKQHKKD